MSEEEKKRIVSQPPPPTDEVDGEWGDEDDKTLVRGVPEAVTKSHAAVPAPAVAGTPVAPISVPAKAAEASTPPEMKAAAPVEDEDEDEDQDAASEGEESADGEHDEDEDEDEDEDAHDAHVRPAPTTSKDWLPDWAPFAVLALLVSVSILVGLGLVGGSADAHDTEENAGEAAAEVAKPAAKPSNHP
ncbi:MAG: hypothetical protein K0R38_3107 [Polyangiaceae bacterium]|jgi:hypothetical protein|nr:hypothetical protein [Polyangiaceae bacterium]